MVPVLIYFDDIFTEFYEERGAFIEKCFFIFKLKIDNLEMYIISKQYLRLDLSEKAAGISQWKSKQFCKQHAWETFPRKTFESLHLH